MVKDTDIVTIIHWPLLFGAPLAVTPLEFRQIFGIKKLESLGYHMALFA